MKILVCLKQVLDAGAPVVFDPDGTWPRGCADATYRTNPNDVYALEEALLLRERRPETQIHALSLGPARVAASLRRALETGAQEAIHLVHPEDHLPALATATLISSYARDKAYDLILTGVMAEDDMQAQVGPMLAVLLGIPHATAVMKMQAAEGGESVLVEREIEGGRREALEMTLPALAGVQTGINRPRYPALSHVLRARTQPLVVVETSGWPLPPPRETIREIAVPVRAESCVFLEGPIRSKAESLVRILHEKALV